MSVSKQKYVTIGMSEISKDIFRKVIRSMNNYQIKPYGGLWASRLNSNICSISDWHDYLLFQSDEFAYTKNVNVGCVFTLKENSKILIIENGDQIKAMLEKYPLNLPNGKTIPNYEQISKDYDAMFLEYEKAWFSDSTDIFKGWDVNTLLLFNLDCIKEYQTIKIQAEPQNYDCIPRIIEESEQKQVINNSDEYNELYNYMEELFTLNIKNTINSFNNYDEYFEEIVSNLNNCISIALIEKKKIINKIKNNLQIQNIKTDENTIVRNVATTILSNHIIKSNNKIKTLKKIDNRKNYSIIE